MASWTTATIVGWAKQIINFHIRICHPIVLFYSNGTERRRYTWSLGQMDEMMNCVIKMYTCMVMIVHVLSVIWSFDWIGMRILQLVLLFIGYSDDLNNFTWARINQMLHFLTTISSEGFSVEVEMWNWTIFGIKFNWSLWNVFQLFFAWYTRSTLQVASKLICSCFQNAYSETSERCEFLWGFIFQMCLPTAKNDSFVSLLSKQKHTRPLHQSSWRLQVSLK